MTKPELCVWGRLLRKIARCVRATKRAICDEEPYPPCYNNDEFEANEEEEQEEDDEEE